MGSPDQCKQWRLDNPDKVKTYHRSEKNLQRSREYSKTHRQKRNSIANKYYWRNREKMLARARIYRSRPDRLIKNKWIIYRSNAKKSGRQFELDFELFEHLINKNCWYCGRPGPNGLDRVDSSKGYNPLNVVACCYRCNGMKSNMNDDEFINAVMAIARKQMAQFKITIQDEEDGRVRVDSEPHISKLTAMARGGDLTPAAAYTLKALSTIIKDSQLQTQEKVKAQFDAGLIPAVQSTRQMFS